MFSKKYNLFFVLILAGGIFGCAGSDNNTYSLNSTYDSLKERQYETALVQLQAILDVYPDIEEGQGLLVKAQIEYALGMKAAAKDTLKSYAIMHPVSGSDDLLLGYYLSNEKGDADQILSYLLTSLNDNYSGLEEDHWWGIVENDNLFTYFRELPQYQTLISLKPPTVENPEGGCKSNVTQYVYKKQVIGPKLYFSHQDMPLLYVKQQLESLLVRLIPEVGSILSIVISQRYNLIKMHDKGCGVILNWTWVTWLSLEGFYTTSQK